MDSLTHIVLGGAIGLAALARKAPWSGFLVGAIAATLPDMDVFVRTGDTILDHALHRSATHALVVVPFLGLLAAVPFAAARRLHAHWRALCLVGVLAALSHTLLDACTSYGTQMFWPFSTARVAWDLIAVVDPVFTLPLVIACALALRRKRPRPALAAMAFCACYMGVAIVQHGRALAVQRAVIASRGHAADHARVLPTLGTVNGYHSVYVHGGQVQCDAVRVPFWRGGVYRPGQAAPVYTPEGLDAVQRTAADRFTHFADGFVARDPADPAVVADMRYSRSADAFRPFWGIRLDPPRWVAVPADDKTVKQIWRDVIGAGEWHEVP